MPPVQVNYVQTRRQLSKPDNIFHIQNTVFNAKVYVKAGK